MLEYKKSELGITFDANAMFELFVFEQKHVRMAYLAIVGSFSVNGVAQLHTELLKEGLFRDFHELWPGKFNNKTNGITPRRWLAWCNPGLSNLITDAIGDGWVTGP